MAKGNKIRITLEIDSSMDIYIIKDDILKKVKEAVPNIMSLRADVSESIVEPVKE